MGYCKRRKQQKIEGRRLGEHSRRPKGMRRRTYDRRYVIVRSGATGFSRLRYQG